MSVDIFGAAATNAQLTRPTDARSFGIAGDTYFKDCSTPSSQDGTQVTAGWLNQITGTLRALTRANGLKLDGVNPVVGYDQLDDMTLRAVQQYIQRGTLNTAFDSGSTNNVVATLPVTPAELLPGLEVAVNMGYAPTGAATLVLTGFAAAPIRRRGNLAIVANDWLVGDWVKLRWTVPAGQAGYWQIVGPTRSDMAAVVAALAPLYTSSAVLYVRPDATGASPTGLTNSVADAFPTVDAALAYGLKSFYFPSGGLTIQLGATGTYTPPANGIGAASGAITVRGDPANQGGYIFAGAGPAAGNGAVFQFSSVTATLIGVTLANTGTINHTLGAGSNASVNIQNVTFSNTQASIFAQIFAGSNSVINILAGCVSASGNTNGNLFNASYGGSIIMFANYWCGTTAANTYGIICLTAAGGRFVVASGNPTFVGYGAAGQRYSALSNSTINTNGAGANFFPGSSAGSTASGGQYL